MLGIGGVCTNLLAYDNMGQQAPFYSFSILVRFRVNQPNQLVG